MHVCFRGGTGDSRVSRSISVIRGFTKNMKAMSLKAKEGGGGGHGRRRRRKEADGGDHNDASGAPSAKIAPAQLQDEADNDDRRRDHELRIEEDKKGGKKQEYCDKCCSPLLDDDDCGGADDGVREWVAEPEPGVLLTLSPRPDGSNRLRRVRFREELFDARAAQSWWADNHDRIVELYSVVQSDDDDDDDAAGAMPASPCQSAEEEAPQDATTPRAESWSPSTSNFSGEPSSGSGSAGTVGSPILGLVTAPDNRSGSKAPPPRTPRAAAAQQDNEDNEEEEDVGDQQWKEWVEEYDPGVFLTVRAYPDHPLQLRHVELSRERFGEVKARVWWEENKDKLRSLYSF
ncbi:putative protein Brevis radix-like 5 [Lolium rigidum]|uniref:putative protein Brevis radix-like 5 n=1 Tax=Lolium rigidum TaxID=89674 RepID=UPI001F5C1DAD|nr:putative protein Brevis radix-like 5 [Lolium rigidum]